MCIYTPSRGMPNVRTPIPEAAQGNQPAIAGRWAMGTMLNAREASFELCFDALNLEQPYLVAEIHRAYIEAGAQIIQTNTFGANRYKLAFHGLEAQVGELNRAGVELARRVVLASFKQVLVAADGGAISVALRNLVISITMLVLLPLFRRMCARLRLPEVETWV